MENMYRCSWRNQFSIILIQENNYFLGRWHVGIDRNEEVSEEAIEVKNKPNPWQNKILKNHVKQQV